MPQLGASGGLWARACLADALLPSRSIVSINNKHHIIKSRPVEANIATGRVGAEAGLMAADRAVDHEHRQQGNKARATYKSLINDVQGAGSIKE